jgi:ADP-ribosylglycohydrolase
VELRDKFLGTIFGASVADALGAPFEGKRRSFMKEKKNLTDGYEKIPGYPIGQYTDDTQMTLKLIESIINKRLVDGADIAQKFSNLWRTNTIIGAGASCRDAMMNIIVHEKSWDESGVVEGRAGNGTAMRVSPIGLFDSDDLTALKKDAATQSIITHTDKRASASAVAVSAAVYYCVNNDNIKPDTFLDFIIDQVTGISDEFTEAMTELKMIIQSDEDAAFSKISRRCFEGAQETDGITPYVVPTVMAALYSFLNTPYDWVKSVECALHFGGDTDTVASITGAISGSLNGVKAIPAHLIEDLKDHDYIAGLALKLYEVFKDKK